MSTPKIVITKPGFDALTETNPKNMIFTSELSSLKYYSSGSVSVSGGNGVTTTEVTHGLGYIPFFTAYIGPINVGGDTDDFCMVPFVFASGAVSYIASCWADSNKLYFQQEHNLGSVASPTFYYKIFKNKIDL